MGLWNDGFLNLQKADMVSVAKKQDEAEGEAPVSAPAPPAHPPLPSVPPTKQDNNGSKPSQDPNLANPRLLVNRSCIYERRLPGDAYITAHVQRLQHGYYSCPAVSDKDFEHVDFLAVNFVFHSPNTLDHRFMAATIRASVHGNRKMSTPGQIQPRFIMHAPHLIYGAVSPETLQWNFGLAGSLGVSEFPVSASISPSGGVLGRYRRYEMMRIQGSARTLKSPHGQQYDIESGEIVWSLEENSLQRSGLPREFTFAMLIHKPRAESRIHFSLDIDPVIQSWYGSYPKCWLSLSRYQPVQRRPIDFRRDIGQRFETGSSSKKKRFNFATLESSFDEYVNMPGRRFTTGVSPSWLDGDEAVIDIKIRPTRMTTFSETIMNSIQMLSGGCPQLNLVGRPPGANLRITRQTNPQLPI